MNWFQVLKGKTKRSDSRTNARLVRTVVRPIVNEFVEREIMPRTNKIYYKEILQIVKKEFIPNPEIRKKIKADPRLKNLTSQQIGSLLNRSFVPRFVRTLHISSPKILRKFEEIIKVQRC